LKIILPRDVHPYARRRRSPQRRDDTQQVDDPGDAEENAGADKTVAGRGDAPSCKRLASSPPPFASIARMQAATTKR
jgi:hypothetical protein